MNTEDRVPHNNNESAPPVTSAAAQPAQPAGVVRKLNTIFHKQRTKEKQTPTTVRRAAKPERLEPGKQLDYCPKCNGQLRVGATGCCRNRVRVYRCLKCGWYAIQPIR